MGRPAIDLIGTSFGFLSVIERKGSAEVYGGMSPTWVCECVCGQQFVLSSKHLRSKSYKSCGCKTRDLQFGHIINKTVGKTYGYLTVLEYARKDAHDTVWVCKCVCGNKVEKSRQYLSRGRHLHCGCLRSEVLHRRTINEVGNVHSNLTVVEYAGSRAGEAYWRCRCSCGSVTEVRGTHLRGGDVQRCASCGTKAASKTRTTHGLTGTRWYKNYLNRKRGERSRKYDNWNVDMEHLLREKFPTCILCGMTEDQHLEKYDTILHVDHVRPLALGFGLKPGNAAILCAKCNRAKHGKPLEKLSADVRTKLLNAAQEFEDIWENSCG